jgi:UDP-N-acetylmuramoyl-L-alanyl-D-glutamate--2,6-diaminopimelate ligase
LNFSGLPAHLSPAFQAGRWLRARLPEHGQLTANSRAVQQGDGFIAYAGQQSDGRAYIADALAAGAAAVAWDSDEPTIVAPTGDCFKSVPNLRRDAGIVSSAFYGEPSAAMSIVAVTGTNGKTSCSQWIAQGMASAQKPAGVIGTLGHGTVSDQGESELQDFGLTTPDAVYLQRLINQLHRINCQYLAIEASSIGIVQSRLSGTHISVAVFTNLSRDHLDFHTTMAAYQQAKAELFAWPTLKTAIVNLNDAASQLMLQKCQDAGFHPNTIGYGIAGVGHSLVLAREKTEQYLLASDLEFSSAGIAFDLTSSWGNAKVNLQLHGEFNVSNALAVLATWLSFGVSLDLGVEKLKDLKPVQGRLQAVDVAEESSRTAATPRPLVFVDYAHTPDALSKALLALQPLAVARKGHLWCMFGAGGDRDKGKRPLMATAVQRTAQKIVVTSDNPRSEDPLTIVGEILKGFDATVLGNVSTIVDRKSAIEHSIGQAGANDVILLAGKGHEPYQEISGVRYPFSDVAIAAAAIQKKALQ